MRIFLYTKPVLAALSFGTITEAFPAAREKKPEYKRTSDVSKGDTKVVSLQCPEPAA